MEVECLAIYIGKLTADAHNYLVSSDHKVTQVSCPTVYSQDNLLWSLNYLNDMVPNVHTKG